MNKEQALGPCCCGFRWAWSSSPTASISSYFSLPCQAPRSFFEGLGLPGFTAYLVFAGEAAGGVALLLGVQVRYVAAGLAVIAAGATWAHVGAGWVFSNAGGGWEYPAFLTAASIVQALLGPGAYALGWPSPARRDAAAVELA